MARSGRIWWAEPVKLLQGLPGEDFWSGLVGDFMFSLNLRDKMPEMERIQLFTHEVSLDHFTAGAERGSGISSSPERAICSRRIARKR